MIAVQPHADGSILPATDTAYGGAMGVDRIVGSNLRLGAFVGAGAGREKVELDVQSIDATYAFGGVYGQAADIARHAQEIVKLKRRLNEIYAGHTGQTVEAVEKALDRDTYMTSEEAKNFGLVDQVLSRRSELGEMS